VIPTRYQPSKDRLAEFIRKHPWWQWLTRTPFSAKMTKYALSSVIAFMLSNVTFALLYLLNLGTTAPSIIAFFAAAIPNWIMNRRWAWQQTGRAPVKQMLSYAAVSATVLLVTTVATGRTNHWVKLHVVNHHGLRLLIVTAVYVFVNVAQFLVKFAIYEFVIFRHDGPRSRRAGRGQSPATGDASQVGDGSGRGQSPAIGDASQVGDGSGPESGSEPRDDSEPPATWNEAASALPSAHGRT
jgi:putative flippase GtrA